MPATSCFESARSSAADDLLGGDHRAARESLAVARPMRDLDEVVGRVEEERVEADLRADARRRDLRVERAVASLAHFLRETERGTARRVLLL